MHKDLFTQLLETYNTHADPDDTIPNVIQHSDGSSQDIKTIKVTKESLNNIFIPYIQGHKITNYRDTPPYKNQLISAISMTAYDILKATEKHTGKEESLVDTTGLQKKYIQDLFIQHASTISFQEEVR